MAYYIGRWDCEYCGNKGVMGNYLHCTKCGAKRPKEVTFYLPTEAEIIEDEKEIADAESGPDWYCSHCNGHNKVTYEYCKSCGSAWREQDGDTFLKEREFTEENVPRSADAPQTAATVVPTKKGLRPGVKRAGIIGAIIAAITGFLSTFSSTIDVEITSFEWERTVQVEKYTLVTEEDWQVPAGGKQLTSFRDIHHYNKVSRGFVTKTRTKQVQTGTEKYVCGKRDMGNGYFQDIYCDRPIYQTQEETYDEEEFDNVPVYATKYRYTIMKWIDDEPLKTSGKDHNAQWGTKPELNDPNKFRIKNKWGKYWIFVKDHRGENHKEEFQESKWQALKLGDKLPALKSTFYGYYKKLKIDQ